MAAACSVRWELTGPGFFCSKPRASHRVGPWCRHRPALLGSGASVLLCLPGPERGRRCRLPKPGCVTRAVAVVLPSPPHLHRSHLHRGELSLPCTLPRAPREGKTASQPLTAVHGGNHEVALKPFCPWQCVTQRPVTQTVTENSDFVTQAPLPHLLSLSHPCEGCKRTLWALFLFLLLFLSTADLAVNRDWCHLLESQNSGG